MKKLVTMGTALVFLLTLTACTTVKQEGTLAPVYITNSKPIQLLPPQDMNGAVDNLQQLKGTFGDENFSLLVYFQSDYTGIFMALLNDFGTDMGNITYDGNYVEFETTVFPQNLKAEYIIADIQNAYYKTDAVRANLEGAKLKFTEEKVDGITVRKIFSGKKLIEEIKIEDSTIIITNHLRGYEYILTVSE